MAHVQRDSDEYVKLFTKKSAVVSALAAEGSISELASKLRQRGLITEDAYSKANEYGPDKTKKYRIEQALDAVLDSVRMNSTHYTTFISVLKSINGLEDIVEFIETSLSTGSPKESHTEGSYRCGEDAEVTGDIKYNDQPSLFDPTTIARKTAKSKIFGGTRGGSPWDDGILNHCPAIVGVRAIAIRHGNQVDSIQVTYLLPDGGIYTSGRHGGCGGSLSSLNLAEGEMIIRVEGKTNNVLVDQVTFITRKVDGTEKQYGPYGRTGRTPFSIDGYVVGFFGRAGNLLDGLGVYYLPQATYSMMLGGKNTLLSGK